VDIYSIGVVAYALLTGYPPFSTKGGRVQDYRQPLKWQRGKAKGNNYSPDDSEIGRVPFLPVSDCGKLMVSRMLACEPTQRLNAEEALRDSWFSDIRKLLDS
jgi:serine/threonine protein kinase